MTFEPLELAALALLTATAVLVWSSAGRARRAALVSGLVLAAAALLAEPASLPLHIAQHVVLWDLAPIALLGGARRLPPGFPVWLANPVVALPLWLGSLALWHVPAVFDAALRHGALHQVQHVALLAAGLAMWAPIVGAAPAPRWFAVGARFGYVAVMQLAGLAFGNVLLWSGPLYAAGQNGQHAAGGIVLIEGSLVAVGAFAWLFLRLVAEDAAPALTGFTAREGERTPL